MFYHSISKWSRTISSSAVGLEIMAHFICEAVWNHLKNSAMEDTDTTFGGLEDMILFQQCQES